MSHRGHFSHISEPNETLKNEMSLVISSEEGTTHADVGGLVAGLVVGGGLVVGASVGGDMVVGDSVGEDSVGEELVIILLVTALVGALVGLFKLFRSSRVGRTAQSPHG
jgi:hypothetical protein